MNNFIIHFYWGPFRFEPNEITLPNSYIVLPERTQDAVDIASYRVYRVSFSRLKLRIKIFQIRISLHLPFPEGDGVLHWLSFP